MTTTTTTTTLERVAGWWRTAAEGGINLSPAELRRRCLEEGLAPPPHAKLRRLRNRWVASAMFHEPRQRGRRSFASAHVFKLGTVFIGECCGCRSRRTSRLTSTSSLFQISLSTGQI